MEKKVVTYGPTPDTIALVLQLCREGLSAADIADDTGETKNVVAGILSSNGGAAKVRGYKLKAGPPVGSKYKSTGLSETRSCYICGTSFENPAGCDYRMCDHHRAEATASWGNPDTDCGGKRE